MLAAILRRRDRSAPTAQRGGGPEKELNVGKQELEHADVPAHRRNPIERAILVPVGAALLAAEELLGVATALVDAEKAGRELLHFEERGMRARTHVEGLVHHHRHRVADNLELRIEQARRQVNDLATKSGTITSKIRPDLPNH